LHRVLHRRLSPLRAELSGEARLSGSPARRYIDIISSITAVARGGGPEPIYDHHAARSAWRILKPSNSSSPYIGCHRAMRDCYDVKIYLDPEEELRVKWKIHRDTTKRGYSLEDVKAMLEKRKDVSVKHIHPQRTFADIVIRFQRPAGANGSDTQLDARQFAPNLRIPLPPVDGSSNAGHLG
jgi:phosphoribulokinase